MIIDCATCPARNRACEDCLMQVLFRPATRDFGPGERDREAVGRLLDAVDVLTDTALISEEMAQSARSDIFAGQNVDLGSGPRLRRVV